MLPWVLLPGTLCTGACFASTLAALRTRGFDPPTSTFVPGSSADPVEDANNLLKTAPERFAICAFSLGGFIAFQAALAAPERIVALILISVTGRADPAENASVRRAQVERARRESSVAVIRDTLWPNYVAASSLNDCDLQRNVEAMAEEVDLERYARQTEIAIVRPDIRDAVGSLRMPVLLISGEADVATPPERGAEIAATLTDGRHAVIADSAHFVMMEQAETTADVIAAWIESTRSVGTNWSEFSKGDNRP